MNKHQQAATQISINPNMKTSPPRMRTHAVVTLLAACGLALLFTGCASPQGRAPAPSGFLSHYCQLQKVDDLTWRYVNNKSLSNYDKFRISEVKVLAVYFEGAEISDATKQKVQNYVREAITKALSDRYSIVTAPGPDVGDIRVAITAAYKTEDHLGLTVEGEILDSRFSGQLVAGLPVEPSAQLAAVLRTEVSRPYFSNYWDAPAFKELVNTWAARLRQTIDAARGN